MSTPLLIFAGAFVALLALDAVDALAWHVAQREVRDAR